MAELAPSCFHQMTSEYGVEPLMLNCADFESSEGDSTFSAIEYVAAGPEAFAPAHTVQLSHAVI